MPKHVLHVNHVIDYSFLRFYNSISNAGFFNIYLLLFVQASVSKTHRDKHSLSRCSHM